MENEPKNAQAVGLIRSIFTSEVRFVIGIAGFVFGIAAPYFGIKQDIALIRSDISNINSNHEVHIQDIMQDIKDLKVTDVNQQAQLVELQKQLLVMFNNKK